MCKDMNDKMPLLLMGMITSFMVQLAKVVVKVLVKAKVRAKVKVVVKELAKFYFANYFLFIFEIDQMVKFFVMLNNCRWFNDYFQFKFDFNQF